jgi:hypothetical protein
VQHLEEQTPIAILPGTEPRSLEATVVAEGEPDSAPSTIVGPIRIDVVSATLRPDFTNPDHRVLRMSFELLSEPRLRLLFAHVAAADFTVSNDVPVAPDLTRQTFPPLNPQADIEVPLDKPGPVRLSHDVVLKAADELSSTVTLQGTVDVEVAAAEGQFVFRHLKEPGPVTRRHGGVSVSLEGVEQEQADLTVTLRIQYESGSRRFESHRAWVFHNELHLVAGEESHSPIESQTLIEGDEGALLSYRFAGVLPLPEDAELHYVAPSLITRIPVEFVISGIGVNQ